MIVATMKHVFCFLLLVSLSACAATQPPAPQSLPKQFLGEWGPFSVSAAFVSVKIQADGTIQDIFERDDSIVETSTYDFISSPDPQTAFILETADKGKRNQSCVRLKLRYDKTSISEWTFLTKGVFRHIYPAKPKYLAIAECQKIIAKNSLSGFGEAVYARYDP